MLSGHELDGHRDSIAADLLVDSLAIMGLASTPRPTAMGALGRMLDDAQAGRLPPEPGLLAQLAGAQLAAGCPAEQVARVARAALAGLPADDGFYGILIGFAVVALIGVDELDAADRPSSCS